LPRTKEVNVPAKQNAGGDAVQKRFSNALITALVWGRFLFAIFTLGFMRKV
jgi:hypothetical protein